MHVMRQVARLILTNFLEYIEMSNFAFSLHKILLFYRILSRF